MKKAFLCIISLLICFVGLAEQSEPNFEEMMSFIYENNRIISARPFDAYSIRAAYEISLPEGDSTVDEAIEEAYRAYKHVYLLEIGYRDIEPIVQSSFVCVGIGTDGAMDVLKTPFNLIARTYDPSIFNAMEITEIDF